LLSAGCQGFLYWEWAGWRSCPIATLRQIAADKGVVARVSGRVRGVAGVCVLVQSGMFRDNGSGRVVFGSHDGG